jgi:hypothetical protein
MLTEKCRLTIRDLAAEMVVAAWLEAWEVVESEGVAHEDGQQCGAADLLRPPEHNRVRVCPARAQFVQEVTLCKLIRVPVCYPLCLDPREQSEQQQQHAR